MKPITKLFLFIYKLAVTLGFIAISFSDGQEFAAGHLEFIQLLMHLAVYVVIWRIARGRAVLSLLCRVFNWDPFAVLTVDRRRINARYDAWAAQNAQRQAQANAAAYAQRQAQANAAAYARYQARDKAIWHEYQARQQAGTYSGYQHANQARQYRQQGW